MGEYEKAYSIAKTYSIFAKFCLLAVSNKSFTKEEDIIAVYFFD